MTYHSRQRTLKWTIFVKTSYCMKNNKGLFSGLPFPLLPNLHDPVLTSKSVKWDHPQAR